jgi:hypothetical protein
LDHFFRSLGHAGAIEAGATFEFRVAKRPGSAQPELIVGGNGAPGQKAKGVALDFFITDDCITV